MTETIIGGRRSRFIATRTAPGVVVDTWEDLEVPPDDEQRVGLVLTFETGQHLMDPNTGVPNPHVPDTPIFVMGYDDAPGVDPVGRFREAYSQERAAAAERLGGPLHFAQAWPPEGSRTLVACIAAQDTRDGWVRVTWLPDSVVVQGVPENLRVQVPADATEAEVMAWAENYGFATIDLPN